MTASSSITPESAGFAETDINGLQKQGIPTSELMASLFEAIIGQNLSVLTRGHTLRSEVILPGGPNTYIRGTRSVAAPHSERVEGTRGPDTPTASTGRWIVVPQNAQYYAAVGAVEYGGRGRGSRRL
jgi:activator of 2-hydroxyglutaryl-CoA dehydratase